MKMLAFTYARKTLAYKRHARGLSRSVSAFSSFMREYLDPVFKADQCAQYVDDIRITANIDTDVIRNGLRVHSQAGLILIIERCHLGVSQIEFLG